MLRSVTLEALVAFVGEHRRCGVLDGGRDNEYVWLQCSCGGLITQPASEKPPRQPAAAWPAQLAAPSKEATMAGNALWRR